MNVRTKQIRVILKDNPYSWDVSRNFLLDFSPVLNEEGFIVLYSADLKSRQISDTSHNKENTSLIRKFMIEPDELDSCFK